MIAAPVSMSFAELCRREVRVGGRVIHLGPQKHKMVVALLLRHPERWVSRTEIADYVWAGCILPESTDCVIGTMANQLRHDGVPVEGRVGKDGGYRIPFRGRGPAAQPRLAA